uniref:Tyrosine-protein kinase BAZ1B n=1 Tax=Cyclopterus lumpus TaxID=8103 RepID=A0A8C2XFE2_CYCLU
MAPLLGRKPYPLAKPLAEPPGPGEEVYIVEHTKEAFRNKEEYEARLQRYSEHIWTCKSTGSSQLTHNEAWEEEQEVTELLQEEYPQWFEKPVLEMVHHNTVSLDKLVEMAWLEILTKYAVDEECDFLVGKEKSLQVKVVKIHPLDNPEGESGEKKLEGACDSPSSDKENASQENQRKEPPPREEENRRESLSDRARRSPRKLPIAMKEEKKRWVMPKFLPHKYDVKLINEDKVISDVPADSLYRTERPPTKEIMRYFIRHYALRLGMGESAPWVVEDELVKKFNLPSKFSDFLLDPHKFLAENPSAKRKSLSSPEGKPNKRLKTPDTPGEDSGNEKGEKKRKRKKDSLGMPLSPTIWGHMQKMNGSPLKMKNSGSPKKGEGKGSAPSTPKSGRKSGDKKEGKKTGKSSDKKLNVLKASKKDGKAGAKTPKMKQMTLLHLAKSTSSGSPKKRARSTGMGTPKLGKPLHPMALHLLRYYKENKGKEDKRNSLSSLISKAAKTLSPDDRDRLPEELKELVQKRWELLEQKKRWAAMSEEEKQEEMKKKRKELKEKLREKAKERREKEMLVRREQSRRYEDQEIEGGKTLPVFKLVDMPEGLPNTLFGDVAMVVDFLHCYAGLLMPDNQYPITAVALMEALAGERSGFLYLNRVLVVLLQTLLQDELAEGYSELDIPLSEIPLTMHSVSELARLCLRPCDAHGEESNQGSLDTGALGGFDDVVTSEFLEKLETIEVFELSPEEKVSLLVALCHRILMTYSVEDHVDAMQQRSAEVWKERLAMLKEVNDRKKAEKQMRKEMEVKVLIISIKKKEGSAKKENKKEVKVEPEPEPEDMISSVKSRRLMSMQAKKEKEEMDRQNKERMEKGAEEERMRKQRASVEKAFQEGITKSRLVTRRTQLGTDRNHNRYWLFSDVVPGLYIEKGWVHESIDYNFTPPPEEKPAKPEEEEDGESAVTQDSQGAEQDDGSIDGAISEGAQQGAAVDICIETTVPNQGQNLWFICDNTAELEELVESLHPQGVRESNLKAKIQSRYQDVLHSVHLTRKAKMGLRTCDGYSELLNYLRSDIQEVASRLQKGGLGYLDDNVDIEEQVISVGKTNLKDFGECIITIQACVIKKFLQGFMAPKQKKKKKQGGEESSKAEEVDDEKRLAEEARVATAVEKWKTALREALTFSRMHVLLGMLDACIKWDMSAENARCKVCRRKGDDEKLILCDECNKAFHLFCLRPALYGIPTGEWLCPACQPTVARRGSRSRNYNEDTDDEEEEEEDEEESEEEESEEEDEEENDYKAMGHSCEYQQEKTVQISYDGSPSGFQPGDDVSVSFFLFLFLFIHLWTNSKLDCLRFALKTMAQIKKNTTKTFQKSQIVRQSSQTGVRRQVLELEKCEEILKKLMKFRYSWPFRDPVSVEEAEDYLDIISQPMDFHTMLGKFSQGSYRHAQDFMEDLKLVFSNAEEYNQQGSTVLSCMVKTEQTFTELLQKLLPGLSYLRRRSRKRISQAPATSEEEEEEEEVDEEEGISEYLIFFAHFIWFCK